VPAHIVARTDGWQIPIGQDADSTLAATAGVLGGGWGLLGDGSPFMKIWMGLEQILNIRDEKWECLKLT